MLAELERSALRVEDFNRLAGVIGAATGIKLSPAKRTMVEGRLRRRLLTLGLPDFRAYCRRLFDEGGLAGELQHLIDALTTNKTDFFREPEHYQLLATRCVPDLVAARRAAPRLLKIWSAACSNGAEAYSTAMLLAELAERRGDFSFAILGTDISGAILRRAEAAIYSAAEVAQVPARFRDRFLMLGSGARNRGDVRVVPELRRLVRFRQMNLMDATYPVDRDVDVIFLRNVLIYFTEDDQQSVVRRMLGHLRPGGFLMLGHSESMIGSALGLAQIGPATFQKM